MLKHFPGHGSVPQDSHLTLPVQTRTRKQLTAFDLAPFAAAVEQGVPAIMAGHIDVRAIDPRVPASMSKALVTDVLRTELGFNGLVVTDSLTMAGVQATYDSAHSAVQGLRAGNDVLLMPPSPAAARAGIVSAVKAGRLKRSRLEQAAARQIALLLHYAGGAAGRTPARLGASRFSRAQCCCADRGGGQVQRPTGGWFGGARRRPGRRGQLLGRGSGGRTDGAAAPGCARVADPGRAAAEAQEEGEPQAFVRRKKAWKKRDRRRESALDRFVAAEDARLARGTSIGFTGYQDAAHDGEIAVATNTPYVLGTLGAPVRIATYGDTPGAMSALVDVLLGKATAPGSLPVPVKGVERDGC